MSIEIYQTCQLHNITYMKSRSLVSVQTYYIREVIRTTAGSDLLNPSPVDDLCKLSLKLYRTSHTHKVLYGLGGELLSP